MVQQNREVQRTDFTVSVDAAEGVTTGISAYDRTQAIRILADPAARPEQLVQPGHVFPCARNRAACSNAPATPRRPSTWPSWRTPPERRALRAAQRRRHGATAAAARGVQGALRPADDFHRPAHRIPRQARTTSSRRSARGRFRRTSRFHAARLPQQGGQPAPPRAGHRRTRPEPTLVRVHSENLLGDVFRLRGSGTHHSLTARSRRWRGPGAAWCFTWSMPTAAPS